MTRKDGTEGTAAEVIEANMMTRIMTRKIMMRRMMKTIMRGTEEQVGCKPVGVLAEDLAQ